MPSRRIAIAGIAGVVVIAALGVAKLIPGSQMQEIKFDMGHDIVATAKASGVPRFNTRNVDGLISYGVTAVPAAIPAHYTRPGFEVVWQPIFAITMYADEHRDAARPVESVDLQLDKKFETDAQAQAFVEQTIAQFRKGRWQRYYNPTWDALLSGRSSFLDQKGDVTSPAMTIDPGYKIEPADWVTLVTGGATWRWVGDGVLAQLTVDADRGIGNAAPTYRASLTFDLLDVKLKQDADNGAAERKKYDAMGKNSTADYEKSKIDRLAVLKVIEANALKRGDQVLAPH